MKPTKHLFTIVLTLSLLSSVAGRAAGQEEGLMVNLTLADGLAGETVHKVMTDHGGRIWIGTSNGLNLYNGKTLQTFLIQDASHHMQAVRDLCETASHTLYAATDAGLYRLTSGSTGFEHILPEIRRPLTLLAVGDTLYIGGQQGLQIYDGRHLTTIDMSPSKKGLDNIVRQYVRTADGLIWFLSRYDLNTYDPSTRRVTRRYKLDGMPEEAPLTQFCLVGDRAFIGTHQYGLYVYDLQTRHAERLPGIGNAVRAVSLSADSLVCVGCDGSGAYLVDPENLQAIAAYHMDAPSAQRLPSNGVYSFYRDAHGVNWFGFVRYGLAYTSHSGTLFRPFASSRFSSLGLNVRCSYVRGHECIIGTQNGFWYVDAAKDIARYFSAEDLGGGHIVNNVAWFEGDFYIGTYDGGLRILDPQTLTLRRQTISPKLDTDHIGDLRTGPDGRLWIGSSDGLFIVTAAGEVTHYTDRNSHIKSGIIHSITFDRHGNAWLTGAPGISLYSVRSQTIVETDFPAGFFNRESYLRGAAGHADTLYMRNGPQLFFTTDDMQHYGEVSLPITLSDKWCSSVVDDCQGHLWLNSERGLFRFDYSGTEMQHFSAGEGLQGEQISDVKMDSTGRLWVSTSLGLFSLNPDSLDTWGHKADNKIYLYQVRQGSQLLANAEEYQFNECGRLRVKWNLWSEELQAEPVLLDYAKQRGRLYEYRLDGSPWHMKPDGQPISISGLFLGTHRLEVRQMGVSGTASAYTLVVLPSGWAIAEAVLLVVALLLWWWWRRYRRYTRSLLMEHQATEQALIDEMDAMEEADDGQGPAAEREKYLSAKLSDEESALIVERMRRYIETHHAYRNPDLKRSDIAEAIHVPMAKLSQVFTLYLKENYYEFVNRYRLEEFKRLAEEVENQRFTITALSEQCGFRRSSFFSTFRKAEGMTPTEYLAKRNIKMKA